MNQNNCQSFMNEDIFSRAEALLGDATMQRVKNAKVLIFGVGGVGSWCAEGLVRSGISNLTIVDFDVVAPSNINRQLMAIPSVVGEPKVEEMRKRLLQINPNAEIVALNARFDADFTKSYPNLSLDKFDYVVDAIDSLDDKIQLILQATSIPTLKFFSSMGAAMKFDPTKVDTAEFWKVKGCPLARSLRNKMKRNKLFPKSKFICVYSDEQVNKPNISKSGSDNAVGTSKGSIVQVTAVFGFTLCSMIINDLHNK